MNNYWMTNKAMELIASRRSTQLSMSSIRQSASDARSIRSLQLILFSFGRGGFPMTVGRVALLVGVAVLVLVANVAASILYMVVYGHVIDPGHDPQYYNDHIQVAGPYCSIVAGIPLMFLAGWWVAGWWRRALGVRAAWIVWLAYTVIDLAILLAAGMSIGVGLLFVVSFATKLAAVHFGARLRIARPAEPDAAADGGGV